MNKLKRFKDDQNGQAMALVALLFVVLLGFGALVVDTGLMADTRSKLQTAADAAALAGASKLPDVTKVESNVQRFIDLNVGTGANHKTEIDKVLNTVKVTVTKNVDHLFAKVLNFNTSTIEASATAVAISSWDGYGLPFINLDQRFWESKYWGTNPELIQLWNKQSDSSGSFELVHSSELNFDKGYLRILWEDGIKVREGNVSNYSQYITDIIADSKKGNPVYAIGLDQERVDTRIIKVTNKQGKMEIIDLNNKNEKLKAEDNILPFQLVLMELKDVKDNGLSGANKIVTGKLVKVYKIGEGELPSGVSGSEIVKTRLIE